MVCRAPWRRSRQIVLERTSEDSLPLKQFITQLDASKLPCVAGTAIYLATRRETAPYALSDNLRHNKVLHDRVVLLTVITERVPYVAEAERMTVEPLDKGFIRMALRFGFAEAPAVPAALEAHQAEFPIDITDTSFFLGRETPVPTVSPELPIWREKLHAFMTRNAVSAPDYHQIPPKRVVKRVPRVEL